MTKLLIVSTSLKSARVLDYTLTSFGFTVHVASSAKDALLLIEQIHFKMILADFDHCSDEFLRKAYPCPVIAIGNHGEESEMLSKMYQGMDDYLFRPFSISELRMLMNKHLERRRLMLKPFIAGDLKIDVARNVVCIKDQIISLGIQEIQVMIRLVKKAGEYVSPDSLITPERIASLKKKIESVSGEVLQIKSLAGVGHKLIAPMV